MSLWGGVGGSLGKLSLKTRLETLEGNSPGKLYWEALSKATVFGKLVGGTIFTISLEKLSWETILENSLGNIS